MREKAALVAISKIQAPRVRFGALLAVALAAFFVAWLLLKGGEEAKAPPAAAPEPASEQDLKSVARTLGYPVYWAGPRREHTYELTRTADGRIYIRYLPAGVEAGDRRASFLAVGTYPRANAFAELQAASRRRGAVTLRIGEGGIAVFSRSRPTSVYFTYPGAPYQVEVYHPSPATARRLVVSGGVSPVVAVASRGQAWRKKAGGASQQDLKALAASVAFPVYWAGAKPRYTYELSRMPDGRIYIRYLPPSVDVGDPRPSFLTIGTYPRKKAFTDLRRASKRPGAVTLRIAGGGIAVLNRSRPTSVYFAYPGKEYQVEVYHPSPQVARRLVLTGRVVAIK